MNILQLQGDSRWYHTGYKMMCIFQQHSVSRMYHTGCKRKNILQQYSKFSWHHIRGLFKKSINLQILRRLHLSICSIYSVTEFEMIVCSSSCDSFIWNRQTQPSQNMAGWMWAKLYRLAELLAFYRSDQWRLNFSLRSSRRSSWTNDWILTFPQDWSLTDLRLQDLGARVHWFLEFLQLQTPHRSEIQDGALHSKQRQFALTFMRVQTPRWSDVASKDT